MAQEEGLVETLLTKYPQVRLLFGTHNIQELPSMLYSCMFEGKKVVKIYSKEGEVYENLPVHRFGTFKAWVNIMYGCDKFCTYCIVPYTRGKQRSRKMSEILKEVQELKDEGYKEITLLGQNVNAYGKDMDNEQDFATLLEEVAKIGIPRVRFTTSHPWDFSEQMIDIIAKYDNIMPFIHLPLQSGDDDVLKLMGRRYTKESYLALYDKIINTIPNVAVSTDIIVGFPNETDEQFEELCDFVKEIKFDNMGVFTYSQEDGTPAGAREDQIPEEVKEERYHVLMSIQAAISEENNRDLEGTIDYAMVEEIEEGENNTLLAKGRLKSQAPDVDGNMYIEDCGEDIQPGDILKVQVEQGFAYDVVATVVE